MPDWSKDVVSSNVANVAYEEEGGRLIVTWNKGSRRSVYSGVPEELALQVASAPSVGSILNSEIKPYFGHHYE
jgi:hypothetical protein